MEITMTYEDSLSLKSTLEDAILKLSGSASMPAEFLEERFRADQHTYVTNFLKKHKTNQLSRDDVIKALKSLNEELGQIKPIDLSIAVNPDEDLKKAVFNWFSKNIKASVLPRFTVDPTLVGGAKITYNGIFLDLSLRNKIDELPLFKRKI